jgi:hypothetical protein
MAQKETVTIVGNDMMKPFPDGEIKSVLPQNGNPRIWDGAAKRIDIWGLNDDKSAPPPKGYDEKHKVGFITSFIDGKL